MVSGRLSLGAQFAYNISAMRTAEVVDRYKLDVSKQEPNFTWKTLEVTGHMRYHLLPERPISFFAHIGAGVYLNKFSPSYIIHGSSDISVDLRRSQSKTNLGINAGPGMMLRLSPSVRLSLEALLHNVFTPMQTMRYLNVTAGLVFGLMPE
jgi:hypothetical protein